MATETQTPNEVQQPPAPVKKIGVKLIDPSCDISAFASTDETRFVLNGLHFAEEFVEATDGRILIRVPYAQLDQSEFPQFDGAQEDLRECVIPKKAVSEAIKSAPAATKKIVRVADDASGGVALTSSDDSQRKLLASDTIDVGKFPNTEIVFSEEQPTLIMALNPKFLKVIADYALKNSLEGSAVFLSFRGPESAMEFDITLKDKRNAKGMLMPMRQDPK